MKKLFSLVLALTLLAAVPAMAQEDLTGYAIANATVQAVKHVDIVAPYSGTLGVFDLLPGDQVEAGQLLATMQTTGLYAPEDGEVGAVFAETGDDATALTQRYGGILGIEPDMLYQLQCNTVGAYNKAENKLIRLGETLYFKSVRSDGEEGTGRVVAVSPQGYVVDILTGDFELSETFSVYRDDKYYARDCVGKGTVTRRGSLLMAGSGRVAEVLVEEGDQVKAGQQVATLMGHDAEPDALPQIVAPEKGVISSVQAVPGQQVWKGQVLFRLELTQEIEVVAEVDEMDLNGLRVGDRVVVAIDMENGATISGTVTEISSLGVTRQNAAYYTVHVSVPMSTFPLGASASVYIPGRK